ncbi:MAG: helix-turn-helix domain-containing protein [Bacteroidota bacterium]|nr:helix-turn-helix domain-containing protein [Bacteroidota bacterium]
MNTDLKLAKELVSVPGDTIQETIAAMGMRQNELAERMGKPESKINDIIKGKEPITVNTALLLERVLGIPANFWLAREANYREELARIDQHQELQNLLEWAKLFPLSELRKRGYIRTKAITSELVAELLAFFGVASNNEWNKIYIEEKLTVAFRASLVRTPNPYAVSAWLRMGELQSKSVNAKEYNIAGFKQSLFCLRTLAKEQPDDFLEQLQEICAEQGVACVFTPSISNARICGATRWFSNKPLIQLSDRYKTNDHFWFAFFHEAAHILKHPRKEIFLEELDGTESDKEKEREADEFASKQLFSDKLIAGILKDKVSEAMILNIAQKADIHPAFVVGRLQRYGKLNYGLFNKMKVPISFK